MADKPSRSSGGHGGSAIVHGKGSIAIGGAGGSAGPDSFKMKPSLGRIVHFREGNEVFAAIITHVYDGLDGKDLVDLVVFDVNNEPATKRRFVEFSPQVATEPNKWFWPPRVV